MGDALGRLEGWFADGSLVRPDPSVPGTVHLARALATLGGVEGIDGGATRELVEAIGAAEQLVFVLADGLGMALLERHLPADAFLRRQVARELRAVFPSATASAVTSLATGAWPAQHAVPGWWVHLQEQALTAVSLPFIERFSGEPLEARGLTTAVYPEQPLLPRYARRTLVLQPDQIVGSAFSRYFSGETRTQGFGSLEEGVDHALAFLGAAAEPGYVYLYIPTIDHEAHHHGVGSEEVGAAIRAVNAAVERLHAGLAGGRLVLSADHGLIDVPAEAKRHIGASDPLMDALAVPPTGEPRVPLFHTKPGQADAFRAAFEARFGDTHILLGVDEVESLGLLGPAPLGARARERVGEFLALTDGPGVIVYRPGEEPAGFERLVGYHGGLLPDEVRVPLVVA
jgi:hypothetical protein